MLVAESEPIFAQVNTDLSIPTNVIPPSEEVQLSKLPPSTSAAVIVTFPEASKYKFKF